MSHRGHRNQLIKINWSSHKLWAQLRGTHKAVPLTQDTFVQTLHFPGHSPDFFRTTKDELLYSTQRFVLTFPHFPGQLVWYYIFVMACHLLFFFFLISSIFFQRHACHFGDNPLRAAKRKGSVSGIMVWMHDLCSKASTTSSSSHGGPTYGRFQLDLPRPRQRIPKARPTDATWFQCAVPAVSFYIWSVEGTLGGGEGGHAWIPKHGTLEKVRGMKGETRLLCRQSPFSANHSKSLFVLDPCSTPSPPHAHHPAAVIKHSFISLHPLVQFGHIIPCLSRGNLHKRPERTHLIYCVCKIRVAIQEGGEKYVMQ